jgi:hypothetical protein
VLALGLTTAGCARDITVHLRTGDRPPDPNAKRSSGSSLAEPQLVSGIALDRVRVVVRDLRLQATPTADGSASTGDEELVPRVLLVELAGAELAPSAMTEIVPARNVAWKSFYQAVLELGPVAPSDVTQDPALAPFTGKTLALEGRMPGGEPFVFESSVASVLVLPLVFRTGLNHNNLTVNVALDEWFQGPAGEPLDPRDPAAHSTIEANILNSINAYMDDNQDGIPDILG